MKELHTLAVLAAAAAITLSACEQLAGDGTQEGPAEYGTLTVKVDGIEADISTRAADTAANGADKTVSNIQILIFDASGTLLDYKNNGTSGSYSRALRAGEDYTVAALVNGPDVSSKPTLQELNETVLELGAGGLGGGNETYAMYGFRSLENLSTGQSDATVTVANLAARIRIKSVTNELPPSLGAIKLESVFLCNAKGKVCVNGDNVSSSWCNAYGQGSDAPAYTAYSTTVSVANGDATDNASFPHYFYTYPNLCVKEFTSAVSPTGLDSNPQAVWLCVKGSVVIGGSSKDYYWTLNLGGNAALGSEKGIRANYTYDVAVTIKALGSDNPYTPTVSGTADITVETSDWVAGGDVSEEF